MSNYYMTEREQDQFQDLLLTEDNAGAEAFPVHGAFEIHPRGDDFTSTIQNWLSEHSFRRAVDPQRGTFYFRAAPSITLNDAAEQLGLSPDTLRRQAGEGKLDALKNASGDWRTTQHAIEQYRREYLGQNRNQSAKTAGTD